jgi:hypothetical protein
MIAEVLENPNRLSHRRNNAPPSSSPANLKDLNDKGCTLSAGVLIPSKQGQNQYSEWTTFAQIGYWGEMETSRPASAGEQSLRDLLGGSRQGSDYDWYHDTNVDWQGLGQQQPAGQDYPVMQITDPFHVELF